MKIYISNLGMLRMWLPQKILLIMKLIVVIFFTCLMQVSASSLAQKITLSENNASLEQVLNKIKAQSKMNILFADDIFEQAKKVNIKLSDVPLKEALDKLLENQQLSYELSEHTIVISKKTPSFLDHLAERWASIDVRGRVVDAETGQALAGASVKVKGTNRQTNTNAQGNFYLQNVNEDAVIEISFVGYLSKEVRAEKEMVEVRLTTSNSNLDAVQVIAYGTTTKRTTTANIATVKSDVIERQPVSNLISTLQGRAPGVFVTQSSGVAGGDVKILIQGRNSIERGNEPFFVVDGVPYAPRMLPSTGSVLSNSQSPFAYLNPADIESIEVLKDASATSIYGSRAANGAVLITTKKGKPGKAQSSFDLQRGWAKVPRMHKLLNAKQYLQLRREAKKNDNAAVLPFDYDLNGSWDTTRTTDWQKELLGHTAQITNLQASLSGGTAETRYMVNGGYMRETSVFGLNFANQKGVAGFSFQHTSANQKFNLQLSANYLVGENPLPNRDMMSEAIRTPPVAPKMYNDDGSVNWQILPDGNSSFIDNPAARYLVTYANNTQNLTSSALLSYQIVEGLTIKSSFGYNNLATKEVIKVPVTSIPTSYNPRTRAASFGDKYNKGVIIEPQIEYKTEIGAGNLQVLIGSSYQDLKSYGVQIEASGFNSDLELSNIKAASSFFIGGTTQARYRYNALFGRVGYNYANKYLLNFDARRDGSSRFGSENQFHNFFAVGAAWNFSEESFIKNKLKFLSFGKLRASYGTTGNDQVGDYTFLNLYSSLPVQYQGSNVIAATGHANPFVQWELTKKFNVGLDLGFLNNRILLDGNYYINSSSNQLLQNPISVHTGFPAILQNLPATVRNSGLEMLLTAVPVQKKSLRWTSSLNLTIPRNKLVSFPGLAQSQYANRFIVGQPTNIARVYRLAGVNPQSGAYEFYNAQGNKVATPVAGVDNTSIINTNVKYYSGWTNTVSYKGFEFDFLLYFVKQRASDPFGRVGLLFPGTMFNQPLVVLDRWRQVNDMANVQRATTTVAILSAYSNARNSDAVYQDVSFISLKNATLSYSLPAAWTRSAHLGGAKIFVQGQNLGVLNNINVLNPDEPGGSEVTPPLRVVSVGIRFNL